MSKTKTSLPPWLILHRMGGISVSPPVKNVFVGSNNVDIFGILCVQCIEVVWTIEWHNFGVIFSLFMNWSFFIVFYMLAKDREVLRLVFNENVRLRQVFEIQLYAFSNVHMKPGNNSFYLKAK